MLKARISLVFLALILLLSSLFSCAPESAQSPARRPSASYPQETDAPTAPIAPPENKAVVGSLSSLSGNFRWDEFTSDGFSSADAEIIALTNGLSLIATTKDGEKVWDSGVVKSHTEEEVGDDLVITIELFENLRFSDGSPIKAENYLAFLLAFSSPVALAAGASADAGATLVGYDEFFSYTGLNDGKAAVLTDSEGNRITVTASKLFSGVRLLGDYSFSLTVSGAKGYYPSYFADLCAELYPYPTELVLGADVTIKDDGSGAYLDGPWYDKHVNGYYLKAVHLSSARYDVSHAFSGAYTISLWDSEKRECTLSLNPHYPGTYDSHRPSIETIVYTGLVKETMFDALKLGVVDVVSGISGVEDCLDALELVRSSDGSLVESAYLSPEHSAIRFDCSFGPTYFTSFRRALAFSLDTEEISMSLFEDFGKASFAPFSPENYARKLIGGDLELSEYSFSPSNAIESLVNDGWIYNADGSLYTEGEGGVRYRKLTAEEAALCNGANISYSITDNEGTELYATVLLESGDYLLPCAIALKSDGSELSALLAERFTAQEHLASIGMAICPVDSSFSGPACASIACADFDSLPSPSVDNRLTDPYDLLFPYAEGGLSYLVAMERSGGRLGLDYLKKAMIRDASTPEQYARWWGEYMERWTELVPDIPLVSPYSLTVYNSKIKNFSSSPYYTTARSLIYCRIGK